MSVILRFPRGRRRGSMLLATLFVVVTILLLMTAILPMTVTGYGVAQADRDRAAALAAAEAGLNWEIARVNNRLWGVSDRGSAVTTLDRWPDPAASSPNASTVTLATDGTGEWTRRFLTGASTNPLSLGAGGSLTITAEGQVRAADGQIVRRRVECGGVTLMSLFDTAAVFALSHSTSISSPAWSMGGSCSVAGGCGCNGAIIGNNSPSISGGPIGLWGSGAFVTGVTATGVPQVHRAARFASDTADAAANWLRAGTSSGAGVAGWAPSAYNADGSAAGPLDSFGRAVNSGPEIVTSDGVFYRSVQASEFLDGNNQPVLDHHLKDFDSQHKLRLKPGVYYFAQINLSNSDAVEIANDWYKADGQTPLWDANHQPINGPATSSDYDSLANRITIFVDAITPSDGNGYADSSLGAGLSTALLGDKTAANPLRYRRPGNFRIYARNTGNFGISGSSDGSVELDCNLLHYDQDASGNGYGAISLGLGCQLYGGLFGWTVAMSGSASVRQYGSGGFSGGDPVVVIPAAGSGAGGGAGGWQWQEIAASS